MFVNMVLEAAHNTTLGKAQLPQYVLINSIRATSFSKLRETTSHRSLTLKVPTLYFRTYHNETHEYERSTQLLLQFKAHKRSRRVTHGQDISSRSVSSHINLPRVYSKPDKLGRELTTKTSLVLPIPQSTQSLAP